MNAAHLYINTNITWKGSLFHINSPVRQWWLGVSLQSKKTKMVINYISTPHSWRHKRARKELLDWYSDKQQVMSLKNTLLESSSQKTRSPIFPCPYSRASSSQVQLHLDTRFLGNSNSPPIRTKSDSLGFTSYIYSKLNFENPKPRSQQCFVAPFLCISPVIPVTASDFMLCLSEIQSPNALRASIFSSCVVPTWLRNDIKINSI